MIITEQITVYPLLTRRARADALLQNLPAFFKCESKATLKTQWHAQNAVLDSKCAEIAANTQQRELSHAQHFASLHYGRATTIIQSAECTRSQADVANTVDSEVPDGLLRRVPR